MVKHCTLSLDPRGSVLEEEPEHKIGQLKSAFEMAWTISWKFLSVQKESEVSAGRFKAAPLLELRRALRLASKKLLGVLPILLALRLCGAGRGTGKGGGGGGAEGGGQEEGTRGREPREGAPEDRRRFWQEGMGALLAKACVGTTVLWSSQSLANLNQLACLGQLRHGTLHSQFQC